MVFQNDCFPRIMSNARPYPALRNPTPNIAVIAWGWIGFSDFFSSRTKSSRVDFRSRLALESISVISTTITKERIAFTAAG